MQRKILWIFAKKIEGNLVNIPSDDYISSFTLRGFLDVIEGGELVFKLEGRFGFKKIWESGCILTDYVVDLRKLDMTDI